MGWLLNLLVTLICEGLILVVQDLAGYIENIFEKMYEINVNLGFDKLYSYTRNLALSLVGLYAIKLLFDVYVLHMDGDPDSDPLEMITRICKSVAMIICGQFIIEQLVKFAGKICWDVLRIMGSFNSESLSLVEQLTGFITAYSLSLGYLVIIVVIIIGLLLFIFKAAKRGAELILLGVLIPIFALDILTTNRERWNSFMNETIVTIFGYILQVMCFSIFMALFRKGTATGNIEVLIACLAWLMVVLSAPKWLQKFVHKTGVGDSAKGLARSTANLIPYVMKR